MLASVPRSMRLLRLRRELEETQPLDLHLRPQVDGKRYIGFESRVNEPKRRVGEQPKATKRVLALESGRDLIGQRDSFVGRL